MSESDSDRIDIGWDGAAILTLSVLGCLATAGASLLAAVGLVLSRAIRANTEAPPGHGPVIVLGHRPTRNGDISDGLRARLDRARQIADGNAAPIILLGGATRPGVPTEAELGTIYLVQLGMPAGRVLTGLRSKHTLENLRELRQTLTELGCHGRPVLVTSRVHLARALAMARFMGLQLTACAAENRYRLSSALLLEAMLTHWYLTGVLAIKLTRSGHLSRRIG